MLICTVNTRRQYAPHTSLGSGWGGGGGGGLDIGEGLQTLARHHTALSLSYTFYPYSKTNDASLTTRRGL